MQCTYIMKALKCKTLGAELAIHTRCTVTLIKPLHVDDHLPILHARR